MSDDRIRQTYRLMTYNIGGGHKAFNSSRQAAARVVASVSPDVLALQEVVRIQNADGQWRDELETIQASLDGPVSAFYGATLTLREHMHPAKQAMAHAVFHDYLDWQQGNALVSRWPFHRLGERTRSGTPRSVPLFQPVVYRGNRDTEPRAAILARIGRAPHYPLVVALHLTTLVGERGEHTVRGRPAEAARIRRKQARLLLDLLKEHALERGEIVFLLGDFNATVEEETIRSIIMEEGGFAYLQPRGEPASTHPEVPSPIDHIFVYPQERLAGYHCFIVESEEARQASDHLPVVAEITLR